MTPVEIEQTLDAVAGRTLGALAAKARLIAAGWTLDEATEAVFIALGGGDLVEKGADGLERYLDSGKLVTEVEKEMQG